MTPLRLAASIIIPAHGHAGMTDHCVRTVLASIGNRSDVEIIVVDDASPVPIALATSTDTRVTLVRSEENLRFARACNLGASRAAAPFLIFLNNDTEVQGPWLASLIDCALVRDDIAAVGARLMYRDGTIQHAGIVFSQEDGFPRHVYRGFPTDHPAVAQNREYQAVTGACLLVRRDAFELVDGFDEGFANGFEDVDLCLRLRNRGYSIWYCGATNITHAESVSLRTATSSLDDEDDPNARMFMNRWRSSIHRDELATYAADGLISAEAGDVYPLSFSIAAELGATASPPTAELARLLGIRSRQVFDLEKEVGRLSAMLLDNGIEP